MTITFRSVVEILGKPKEHVEKTLRDYVSAIKKSSKYKVLHEEFENSREAEDGLFAAFVEMEVRAESPEDVLNFCFDYMPSVLEILEPQELTFSDVELGTFLNDLQSRLHQVEMLAKQIKGERDIQAENTALVLRNFLLVLLRNNNYELKMLSSLTGVSEKPLGAFLSTLVSEGVLVERAGFYTVTLKNKMIDGSQASEVDVIETNVVETDSIETDGIGVDSNGSKS